MFIITFIEILIGLTIYFMVNFDKIFIFELLLTSICMGGTYVILAPMFIKIFSLSIGTELFGLTGISIGVANIMGPILIQFFSRDQSSFLIVFLTGVGLCFMKLFALYHFDEKTKISEINKNGIRMNIINDYNDNEMKYL